MRICAFGRRFLLGPVHDHPDMDMEKVKIKIEATVKHGGYPMPL